MPRARWKMPLTKILALVSKAKRHRLAFDSILPNFRSTESPSSQGPFYGSKAGSGNTGRYR